MQCLGFLGFILHQFLLLALLSKVPLTLDLMRLMAEKTSLEWYHDYKNTTLGFFFYYLYYQLNPVEHVTDDEALEFVFTNLTFMPRTRQGWQRWTGSVYIL